MPTFVFDEVDAGVGGASAIEIGRRLARLAASAQVIVVTHLAQVAAYATNHLVVEKGSDGTVTASNVRLVHAEDRTVEMARMLSGRRPPSRPWPTPANSSTPRTPAPDARDARRSRRAVRRRRTRNSDCSARRATRAPGSAARATRAIELYMRRVAATREQLTSEVG